jgi:hypothetical protein
VELGFYSDHLRPEALLLSVTAALAERGGHVESCHVHRGRGELGSNSVTEHERVRLPLDNLAGVDELRGDLLISVEMSNALKYDNGHYTTVTRVIDRVDPSASLVAVLGSGANFEGPKAAKFGKAGRELKEVFLSIVRATEPSFATLTVDWPIVSARAIQESGKATADYSDYFLAERFVGAAAIEELSTLEDSVRTDDGVLVLTTGCFGGHGGDRSEAAASFARAVSRR